MPMPSPPTQRLPFGNVTLPPAHTVNALLRETYSFATESEPFVTPKS